MANPPMANPPVAKPPCTHFDRHLNAFCVSKTATTTLHILKPQSLLDYYPLNIKTSYDAADDNKYLVMRHKPWY